MAKWIDAKVREKKQWAEGLYSLRFEGHTPELRAGQFIRVGVEHEDDVLARPYSLMNVPGTDHLEIFFNVVEEGPLSPKLAALEPGDDVKIAPKANGFLVIEEIPETRDLWMVATGTGVGPFISILQAGELWARYENVMLVYSVSVASELAYQEELQALVQQQPERFRYLPIVTREKVEDTIDRRVTTALADGGLEEAAGVKISREDSHVMMCGNSAMIADMFEELDKRGMKKHLRREPGHITTEKYH